jgi:Excalibur calcium-binding domain
VRPDEFSRVTWLAMLVLAAGAGPVVVMACVGWAGSHAQAAQGEKCSDFRVQRAAQEHLRGRLFTYDDHPQRLDRDIDGLACERLPCPCFRNGAGIGLRIRPKVGGRRDPIIVSFRSSRPVPTRRTRWYSAAVEVYPNRCFHDLAGYHEQHRSARGELVTLKLTGATLDSNGNVRFAPWCLGRYWVTVDMCTSDDGAGDCLEGKTLGIRSFRIVRTAG